MCVCSGQGKVFIFTYIGLREKVVVSSDSGVDYIGDSSHGVNYRGVTRRTMGNCMCCHHANKTLIYSYAKINVLGSI